MKITKGPNLPFYLVTAFFIWISVEKQTPEPLLWWLAFCAVMIPLSFLAWKWNKKQDAKMVRDFPLDPHIQKKYGAK